MAATNLHARHPPSSRVAFEGRVETVHSYHGPDLSRVDCEWWAKDVERENFISVHPDDKLTEKRRWLSPRGSACGWRAENPGYSIWTRPRLFKETHPKDIIQSAYFDQRGNMVGEIREVEG